MHVVRRVAAISGLLALTLTGSLATSHQALAQTANVGHVYINDNSAPVNTIAAFDRHADGSLTPIPGSPFVAGGTGAAAPSQGALQLSADGRYLLAADPGSNQISVLRIGPDGSLRPVEGGPVWSGGIEPVSIAVHGALVFVGNDGNNAGGANYTGFALNPGGQLRPIPGSTVSLPSPTTVGDVIFSPDGTHLVGTRINSSLIDSFAVSRHGLLTPAPGSPFPAQGFGPFGSKFRPTNAGQLYVSNAHNAAGGPAPGTVSAFGVAGDGAFSSIGASPYAAGGQIATCWVEIAHDGRHLFGVNTGSNSVTSFSIATDGSLGVIGSTALHGSAANLGAVDARIDPGDQVLYVVERGVNAVAGLHLNADGSLTELPASPTPLPAGSAALGIVVV
jgi:6-phosphogluconolactonase (cycloisomerase 2 family)